MARNQGRASNVVYGICTNTSGKEDGTPCSKCQNKEKQAIRASKEFVCEECGEPLKKIEMKPDGPNKLVIIIAAAVVVIGGVVASVIIGSHNKAKKEAERIEYERIQDSIAAAAEEARIADSIAAAQAAAANEDSLAAAAVEEARIADSLRQVQIQDSIDKANKGKEKTPTPTPTPSKVSVAFGTYSGPMSGGKPHGAGGTIKVTRSYQIDLKDGRGTKLSVSPGETIENTKFENGTLRGGELHRSDGTRKWFNI